MAKKKKAAAKKAGGAVHEMLVVGSKVKAYVKSKGFMSAGDILDGLNGKVHKMIDEAIARTDSNKRSTVRASDL